MSDVCDRAEGCEAVAARGGRFAAGRRPAADGRGPLPACACGGRPAYRPHPPLRKGGPAAETLACGKCGSAVGPFASRQALAQAWRLGGWRTRNYEWRARA